MIIKKAYSIYFLFAYVCLMSISCAKDHDSSEGSVSIIPKTVSVADYSHQVSRPNSLKHAKNRLGKPSSLVETVYFDDIIADISMDNDVATLAGVRMNQAVSHRSDANSTSLGASSTIISPSTYYRFMLFDRRQAWNNWTATWTVSGASSNWVTSGMNQTYDWYAGSYNEERSLPNLSYDQVTMPIEDVTKEFMAARGKVTTSLKNNYVNFVFERKTAALTFIFDARKMKSKIAEISLSPVDKTVLKGGVFNIRDNSVESLKNPTVSTLDNTKWKNYSSSTGDSVKVATFYTLGTTDINNFEINLDKLVLQNLTSSVPNTQTFYNRTMTLPVTIKPKAGQRNTFTITLRDL